MSKRYRTIYVILGIGFAFSAGLAIGGVLDSWLSGQLAAALSFGIALLSWGWVTIQDPFA